MAYANLLRSYARGPRIWDAASLLPGVLELADAGLIEPVPDSTAYQLTAAGQAELDGEDARGVQLLEECGWPPPGHPDRPRQ
jgi:hypothetical protein